jgi:hypothetical protein
VNRATWALLAASVLFGAAILSFVLTSGGSRVVRTQTTVVEAPPLTPLHDSGPKNNPATQITHRARSSRGVTATGPPSSTAGPQNRRVPVNKRQKPKRTHKPSGGAQQPSAPAQPPSAQPAPRPPVDVQAPASVTVCVRPAGGVNCP